MGELYLHYFFDHPRVHQFVSQPLGMGKDCFSKDHPRRLFSRKNLKFTGFFGRLQSFPLKLEQRFLEFSLHKFLEMMFLRVAFRYRSEDLPSDLTIPLHYKGLS